MKIRIMYDNKPTYLEVPDEDFTLMIDADYEEHSCNEGNLRFAQKRAPLV